MKKINVATVFSGIGAPEQALILEKYDTNIVFACDNGERILPYNYKEICEFISNNHISRNDINSYIKSLYFQTKKNNYVKKTYFANYEISEERWFDDIRFIDGETFKNSIDLFVGGSPCQSFSIMGKRRGLDDTRGTLFYDFARLVKEIKPKVFIYENVTGMITHDNGRTWETIKKVFNDLGYKIYYDVLNSCDYGIPQNRKRLFVVGFKNKKINFSFPRKEALNKSMFDFLEKKVDSKYYLGEKGFDFVVSHNGRAKINENIIRTQKANQEFNWNGDFVFEEKNDRHHDDHVIKRAKLGNWRGKIGYIRQLTPRECLRLMGFPDTFKIAVNDIHAYRQSGNSIVVNVLRNIIREIERSGAFNE